MNGKLVYKLYIMYIQVLVEKTIESLLDNYFFGYFVYVECILMNGRLVVREYYLFHWF